MPRALWSGAISFGLVNAPVRMYTAISEHNVHFNLLHAKSGARIHYKKVTDSHPREIPDDQIVKGYEVSDGEYVTLTDEEIAAAHVEGDKVIEIHDFVPLDEIDPIAFERTYYLGPAEGAERVYALLARALETSGLVGIASFVFHDRDQLACLRVKDGVILLERMYFADEIRDADGVAARQEGQRRQGAAEARGRPDRAHEGLVRPRRLPRSLPRAADGDRRQEAQGRDDHGAGGRGAPRARRPHGGARGEPRRGRSRSAPSPPRRGRAQGGVVAQQEVSRAAMLLVGHG